MLSGHCLACAPKLSSPKALPRGWSVLPPGADEGGADRVSVATLVLCDRLMAKRSEITKVRAAFEEGGGSRGAGTRKSVGSLFFVHSAKLIASLLGAVAETGQGTPAGTLSG